MFGTLSFQSELEVDSVDVKISLNANVVVQIGATIDAEYSRVDFADGWFDEFNSSLLVRKFCSFADDVRDGHCNKSCWHN